MYALIYFDTEDFISPPDSPAHTLPGQLADIMHKHGLQGCFHIHGEKARFLERHRLTHVIESLKRHDVSLHYDRGSIHPTTAEEVSELDWFRGVERVLFRELPGFQALERIFGKCSGLTQHGGTFAAQIVYAAGKLGKPFFYSPFRLPGRNVVWFCNNLLIGGYQANFYFDPYYRDTPKFEASLAQVNGYLAERAKSFDFTAMFGCHPVITIMEKFPDAINFADGANPSPKDWIAPTLVRGVSIPLILQNFERLIVTLVNHPKVEWTTVAGIHKLYGQRPVRVRDSDVLAGADAVVKNGGPTFTPLLSAAELLFLLARRGLAPAERYDVPQVMGPTEEAEGPVPLAFRQECPDFVGAETAKDGQPEGCTPERQCDWAKGPATRAADVNPQALATQVIEAVMASGYLPPSLRVGNEDVSLELALLVLACHALGQRLPPGDRRQLSIEAIPGVPEAIQNVTKYKEWRIHGPRYRQPEILKRFRLQCWTLKPAFTEREYDRALDLGRHLNPMFEGSATVPVA